MDHLYIGWQTDPVLIGGIFSLALIYTLLVGPLRSRLAPDEPFPVRNAVFFYSAVVLFYLAEGSPLHDLAERYSLFAHMIQHNVVSYAVAPLFLAGTPVWLVQKLVVANPRVFRTFRALVQPIPAFFIFSIGYSIWHIPVIYDGALQNSVLHHIEHIVFLAVSLIVWWPIMSRVPELPAIGRLPQLVYLFLLPIAQMAVFAAITFSYHNLYPTYDMAPPWFLQTQEQDQQLAGAFMNVSSMLGFGLPFIVIFTRWYYEETGRTFEGKPVRRNTDAAVSEVKS